MAGSRSNFDRLKEKRMKTGISRRAALQALALLAAAPLTVRAQAALPLVEVYKSPTCGCCKQWIKHLEANGFKVKAIDVEETLSFRARFGMPDRYGSCHTALIGGYVVEGHVPGREIKRLLREKPGAVGIAVPGMPIGSPGMDGPEYNGVKDRYDVLLVGGQGAASVYASYH
jgi:hypothetical protein